MYFSGNRRRAGESLDSQSRLSIEEDYVPNRLIPGEYGDYIIMTIDENGKIAEWETPADITDFIKDED